jgi:hypothetical protein
MIKITVKELRRLIRETTRVVNPELKPDCDTFAVFDFDETLAMTNSNVIVLDKDGKKIRTLTPAEYAIYDEAPGESFDFTEFDIVKEPRVTPLMNILRDVAMCGVDAASILTARGPKAQQPIADFLRTMGIRLQIIDTVNSSNPQAKVDKIKGYVKSYKPRILHFFEDSPKNIAAVKLLAQTNPDMSGTQFVLHHITDPEGDMKISVEEVEFTGQQSMTAVIDSNHV